MKPKKAKKVIGDLMDDFIKGRYSSQTMLILLDKEMESLKKLRVTAKRKEQDNRSGAETYGFDNWEDDLMNISDKWNCQFRIQWMIDLIKLKKGDIRDD